ncbi:MFS transporter [Streptosporangium saharense]|uniref:Putative MFS family arabinose efflux permease n=1 Tax=Streptosporangium saharense TaxID=1706840 RepID=A0A7W7QVM5_9ACTN|nr:MFS transporter [Streptosporangium saharense]MBB4920333.1 putative MFS family arabinose efflux permease [Streptosporangium saharense]
MPPREETALALDGRPPLLSRALVLRFVTVVGALGSLFLLMSVVPLRATTSGGQDAAGLTTGALMLATVVGELTAPRLVTRYGHRLPLAAGLVLLGVPALLLTVSDDLTWTVVICLLRGLGFALTIVAGGTLTAALIPPERRAEGLGLVGVVSGVPSLIGLPLGVWLADKAGYETVFVLAALVALAALLAVPGLPDGRDLPGPTIGVAAGFRTGSLVRPAVVLATTALGSGIAVTFLPLAVPDNLGGVIATALFVHPAAATVARWLAGRHGDRYGSAGLVVPALLASAAGMLLTALTNDAVAVVTGVVLFSAGFGIAQNATLALMYARVTASGYGTVTALWNFAYDAGMGVGAVAFGLIAQRTGYPLAFALTAVLTLAALLPAFTDRAANG